MADLKQRMSHLQEWFATRVIAPVSRRTREWRIRERLVRVLPSDLAAKLPNTFEPMALAEWTGVALQRQGTAFYGKLFTVVLSAFFLADVTALLLDGFIPDPPSSSRGVLMGRGTSLHDLNSYQAIWARNLVNSQGLIPGEDQPMALPDGNAPAVRTTLPFDLVGTLILKDEIRSIATIQDRSAQRVYPVRVEDEIPSMARILQIESRKVTFFNLASNRKEFVEMPEDPIAARPQIQICTAGSTRTNEVQVERQGNSFNVSRTEVDKALQNMGEVLTQARAVPNFENGLPAGYKLFQIVPGSIYEKLGLKNGDVLLSMNGENINDPAKAFEGLNRVKAGESHLELGIKRDGRTTNYTYDIK